jgi:hypothetical protein
MAGTFSFIERLAKPSCGTRHRHSICAICTSVAAPSSEVDFIPLSASREQNAGKVNALVTRELDANGLEVIDILCPVTALNGIDTLASNVTVDRYA